MPSIPSQSAIPQALLNLLALATATFPAGTTVYYGEELPAFAAPLTFQITEITGDQQPAELGQYRREEMFSFICSLTVSQGGAPVNDFSAQLISLMASFGLLSKAIGNNPWLSTSGQNDSTNAVRFAEVGNFRIMSETDGNGLGGSTLDFSVRCTQRVTSLV